MTARTRQAALCMEAADAAYRAMATGAVIDSIFAAASQAPGMQFLSRNAAAIDRIRAERLAEEGHNHG